MFQAVDVEAAGIAQVSQPHAHDWRHEYALHLKWTVLREMGLLPNEDLVAGGDLLAWLAALAEVWARVEVFPSEEPDDAPEGDREGEASRGNDGVEVDHEREFRVLGTIVRGPLDALDFEADTIDQGPGAGRPASTEHGA